MPRSLATSRRITFIGAAEAVPHSRVIIMPMAGDEHGRDFLARVRDAARKRFLFLPHAVKQMTRPERMITAATVEAVVMLGELIEDYPEDVRGHSCLMLGFEEGAADPVHVVCSPKAEYLAVITAYRPKPDHWSEDFRQRS